MKKEYINYSCGDTALKGCAFHNPRQEGRRPGIIVAHAWRGQDDFAREKARLCAEMGYVGFAADLYGIDKAVTTDEEAMALMMPLFTNRKLLQERIKAAVRALSKLPYVDDLRIGAIGFCFGGLTVIELLRSGTSVQGVVSFHGVLAHKLNGVEAQTVPIANKIKGSALVLHGHDDPLTSAQDIKDFQTEMTEASVDWQMNIYGHTSHAFTNPDAHDEKKGLMYQPISSQRAWQAMWNFFGEVL